MPAHQTITRRMRGIIGPQVRMGGLSSFIDPPATVAEFSNMADLPEYRIVHVKETRHAYGFCGPTGRVTLEPSRFGVDTVSLKSPAVLSD